MSTVLGLFRDRERAVAAIESLRTLRLEMHRVRLVGGSHDVGDLAAAAGTATALAAGPAGPVLEGLVGHGLGEKQLGNLEQQIQAGAVVVLGEDLGDEAQAQLSERLRAEGADDVLVVGVVA